MRGDFGRLTALIGKQIRLGRIEIGQAVFETPSVHENGFYRRVAKSRIDLHREQLERLPLLISKASRSTESVDRMQSYFVLYFLFCFCSHS